jgi:integrase
MKYRPFKGTKKDAAAELVRLMASAAEGSYIDASKSTLSEFLDRWESWAATQVSAKSLERYKELAAHHVRPHLGAARIQKLKTIHFAELYGKLQRPKPDGAGLAPRTVGHAHRLLHRVFGHAVKREVIASNPVAAAEPPRVQPAEIRILEPDEVKRVLGTLKARSQKSDRSSEPEPHPLYLIALSALSTGMRRGEIAALRWGDIDFDTRKIRVERSFEQTNAGLTLKSPKTKAGRRSISIPPTLVRELRARWARQQEMRLAIGLGRAEFARADGSPWPPDSITTAWQKTVVSLRLPKVTLHALRHTHVSQLIAANVDVVTVSRRIGHSSPTVTLSVYAHLFGNTDERAAIAVEEALGTSS